MKDLLTKLKKAVDRALDLHAATKEIALAEFPAYVVKSLETILADSDADRAATRLAALRAKVDEVSKQSAGSAEDTESQRVTVTVFEEPGLSAKPTVESDTSPVAAGGALGASAVASPNGMLGKALEQLRQEVDELKRSMGKQEEDDEDEKKRKAKDDEDDEGKRVKAKDDEDDEGTRAKAQDDEEDEGKRAKAKDEEDDENKAGVAKSVSWPLDMNATMPGVESVEKRSPELDWGGDPERVAETR